MLMWNVSNLVHEVMGIYQSRICRVIEISKALHLTDMLYPISALKCQVYNRNTTMIGCDTYVCGYKVYLPVFSSLTCYCCYISYNLVIKNFTIHKLHSSYKVLSLPITESPNANINIKKTIIVIVIGLILIENKCNQNP